MIANRMVNGNISEMLKQKRCPILYKAATTVIPIKEYEEQYGDIDSYFKELKEKLKQLEEEHDGFEKQLDKVKK